MTLNPELWTAYPGWVLCCTVSAPLHYLPFAAFSVFQNEVIKHAVKYNGILNNLCSDPCLSAFQYANKLDMSACDFCGTLCTSLESSPHVVQFEGVQKRFCSDSCMTKFRFNHRKVTPCSWCGSQRDNFDMIERLDSNNKYQLFCSLNCLSLYRVNLQVRTLVGWVLDRVLLSVMTSVCTHICVHVKSSILMIERSQVHVRAGVVGEFSSSG